MSDIREELELSLASSQYSDFGKSRIYLELYKVSQYFEQPIIAYLDSCVSIYQDKIRELGISDIQEWYLGYRQIYLGDAIKLMEDYVRKHNYDEFKAIDDVFALYYPSAPTGSAICSDGSEWIELSRKIRIAISIYENGYYKIASEYLNYEGLRVGSTYFDQHYGGPSVNETEQKKQYYYAWSIKKIIDEEEIHILKSDALKNIRLVRKKHYAYGYTYFGRHIIRVDFQRAIEELQEMNDDALKEEARAILMNSIIFKELR